MVKEEAMEVKTEDNYGKLIMMHMEIVRFINFLYLFFRWKDFVRESNFSGKFLFALILLKFSILCWKNLKNDLEIARKIKRS